MSTPTIKTAARWGIAAVGVALIMWSGVLRGPRGHVGPVGPAGMDAQ